MLLQHPEPYSEHNTQITDKMPAILFPQTAPERDWTPPPYWKSLLQMDESKFDQQVKKWFSRAMVIVIFIAIFLLTCILLFKLILFEIKS